MSTRPNALRLAEAIDPLTRYVLDNLTCSAAADELRRLHALNQELLEALGSFLRAPSVGSNGPGSTTIVVQDFNFRAASAAMAKAKGAA
jgi:hypothetical protein